MRGRWPLRPPDRVRRHRCRLHGRVLRQRRTKRPRTVAGRRVRRRPLDLPLSLQARGKRGGTRGTSSCGSGGGAGTTAGSSASGQQCRRVRPQATHRTSLTTLLLLRTLRTISSPPARSKTRTPSGASTRTAKSTSSRTAASGGGGGGLAFAEVAEPSAGVPFGADDPTAPDEGMCLVRRRRSSNICGRPTKTGTSAGAVGITGSSPDRGGPDLHTRPGAADERLGWQMDEAQALDDKEDCRELGRGRLDLVDGS